MGSLIPLNLYSNAAGATLLISDKRRQIPLTQSSSELVKCGVKGFRYCNLRGLSPAASKLHTCSCWIFHKGCCHCGSSILNPFSVFMSYLPTMSTPSELIYSHSYIHTEYPASHMPSFCRDTNRIRLRSLKKWKLVSDIVIKAVVPWTRLGYLTVVFQN